MVSIEDFKKKYILKLWCIFSQSLKVLLKVITILSKILSAYWAAEDSRFRKKDCDYKLFIVWILWWGRCFTFRFIIIDRGCAKFMFNKKNNWFYMIFLIHFILFNSRFFPSILFCFIWFHSVWFSFLWFNWIGSISSILCPTI